MLGNRMSTSPWRGATRRLVVATARAATLGALALASPFVAAELQPEPVPNTLTLATPYPDSYAVVHDFAFGSLIDSSFSLVDTATRRFKGMVSAGQFATIDVSMARQELYVGETYHSRGTRGERTDLLTVYDMTNLTPVAEVVLPPRRANIVVNKGATALTRDGRFFLVFNMNPGTSVTVIDLDTRSVAGEIATPGCALVYPTVKRSFFMLCGDGGLMNVALAADGATAELSRSAPFIDIDADPLSEKSSRIGDIWYFVSFRGQVQPVSASRNPKPRKTWWLTDENERDAGWRPAGWHWTAGGADGSLWVGMTPDGYDGSHKDPATEVWQFDAGSGKRLQRVALDVSAISIDVSAEDEPSLLVVNAEGALDVYSTTSGARLRTIYDLGASPYLVHRME